MRIKRIVIIIAHAPLFFIILGCTSNDFNIFIKENNIKLEYLIEDSKYITNDFDTLNLPDVQFENLDNFLKIFCSNVIGLY